MELTGWFILGLCPPTPSKKNPNWKSKTMNTESLNEVHENVYYEDTLHGFQTFFCTELKSAPFTSIFVRTFGITLIIPSAIIPQEGLMSDQR